QSAQQILVPLNAKVRMQASLHQHAGAAEGDRFVDLFADFVYCAHIGIRCARSPVEGAERADDVADVRIVDIAVDDVGDDVFGVTAPANLVRRRADTGNVK